MCQIAASGYPCGKAGDGFPPHRSNSPGAAVDVYGYDGQWGYCRYGDLSGFVLMEYLSYNAAGAMEASQSAGAYPLSDYLGGNYLVFVGTYPTGRLVPQDPGSPDRVGDQ